MDKKEEIKTFALGVVIGFFLPVIIHIIMRLIE